MPALSCPGVHIDMVCNKNTFKIIITSEVYESDGTGASLERGDARDGGPHRSMVGAGTPHDSHSSHHIQILHCEEEV